MSTRFDSTKVVVVAELNSEPQKISSLGKASWRASPVSRSTAQAPNVQGSWGHGPVHEYGPDGASTTLPVYQSTSLQDRDLKDLKHIKSSRKSFDQYRHGNDMDTSDSLRTNQEERRELCLKRLIKTRHVDPSVRPSPSKDAKAVAGRPNSRTLPPVRAGDGAATARRLGALCLSRPRPRQGL